MQLPAESSHAPEAHSPSFAHARQSWVISSQTGVAAGQLALTRHAAHALSTQTGVLPSQSSLPSQLPGAAPHSLLTQTPSGQGFGLLEPIFAHSSIVTQHAFELGPASSSPMLAGRGKSHAASRMDTTRSFIARGTAIAQMLVNVAVRANGPCFARCCRARCRSMLTHVMSMGMGIAATLGLPVSARRSAGEAQDSHDNGRAYRRRQMKNTGTPIAMIAVPLIALTGSSMNRFRTIPVPAATNTSGTIG
jgi:hypothetical protein